MAVPLPTYDGSLKSDFHSFAIALQSYYRLFDISEDAEKLALLTLALHSTARSWLMTQGPLGDYEKVYRAFAQRFGSSLRLQSQQLAAQNTLATRSFRDMSHGQEDVATFLDEVQGLLALAGVSEEADKIAVIRRSFAGFPICARMLSRATSLDHAVLQALTWESLIIAESSKSRRRNEERSVPQDAESLVHPQYVFPIVPVSPGREQTVSRAMEDESSPTETLQPRRSISRTPSIRRVSAPPMDLEPVPLPRAGEAFSHNVTPSHLSLSTRQPSSTGDTSYRTARTGHQAVHSAPLGFIGEPLSPRQVRSSKLQRRSGKRARSANDEGGSEEGRSAGGRLTNFLGSFRRRASSDGRDRAVAGSGMIIEGSTSRSSFS